MDESVTRRPSGPIQLLLTHGVDINVNNMMLKLGLQINRS